MAVCVESVARGCACVPLCVGGEGMPSVARCAVPPARPSVRWTEGIAAHRPSPLLPSYLPGCARVSPLPAVAARRRPLHPVWPSWCGCGRPAAAHVSANSLLPLPPACSPAHLPLAAAAGDEAGESQPAFSVVARLFEGRTQNVVTCQACGTVGCQSPPLSARRPAPPLFYPRPRLLCFFPSSLTPFASPLGKKTDTPRSQSAQSCSMTSTSKCQSRGPHRRPLVRTACPRAMRRPSPCMPPALPARDSRNAVWWPLQQPRDLDKYPQIHGADAL